MLRLRADGTYLEIERPDRLVSTEVFEGYPDGEASDTLTLTERRDGTTVLSVTVVHTSKENRDGHIASGMDAGMQPVLDRVEVLLLELQARVRPTAADDAQ